MADYVIRATAAQGQIRAFAATTRDLVEQARISQSGGNGCPGQAADGRCDDGL